MGGYPNFLRIGGNFYEKERHSLVGVTCGGVNLAC